MWKGPAHGRLILHIPRTLHHRRGWPMKRKEESEHIMLFARGGGPSVFRIFGPLPTQESVPRHPLSCMSIASPCNIISSIPNSNILARPLMLTFVASNTRFPRLNPISARPHSSSRDSPNLSSRLRHHLETRRASHELPIRQPLPRQRFRAAGLRSASQRSGHRLALALAARRNNAGGPTRVQGMDRSGGI